MPRGALHVTPRAARGGVLMRPQLQAHDRRNVAEDRQAASNTPPAMIKAPKMAQARAGRSSSRPRSMVGAPLPRLVAMLTQPASPLSLSGLSFHTLPSRPDGPAVATTAPVNAFSRTCLPPPCHNPPLAASGYTAGTPGRRRGLAGKPLLLLSSHRCLLPCSPSCFDVMYMQCRA